MTHPYEWHDSFICVACFIRMCGMSHSYVWRDPFICVAQRIHALHDKVCCRQGKRDSRSSHVPKRSPAHVASIWATWLIHVCSITHSRAACRNSIRQGKRNSRSSHVTKRSAARRIRNHVEPEHLHARVWKGGSCAQKKNTRYAWAIVGAEVGHTCDMNRGHGTRLLYIYICLCIFVYM